MRRRKTNALIAILTVVYTAALFQSCPCGLALIVTTNNKVHFSIRKKTGHNQIHASSKKSLAINTATNDLTDLLGWFIRLHKKL